MHCLRVMSRSRRPDSCSTIGANSISAGSSSQPTRQELIPKPFADKQELETPGHLPGNAQWIIRCGQRPDHPGHVDVELVELLAAASRSQPIRVYREGVDGTAAKGSGPGWSPCGPPGALPLAWTVDRNARLGDPGVGGAAVGRTKGLW